MYYQKEQFRMTSLIYFQETIHKIGYAYDNLHRELTGLTEKTERKKSSAAFTRKDIQAPQSKKVQSLDKRVLRDIQIQAITKAKNHSTLMIPFCYNKTAQSLVRNIKNKSTQCLLSDKNKIISRNVSTITRYPLKSTGVGNEAYKRECKEDYCKQKTKSSHPNIHKCCKDYECYNPYDNWKF
jgi:hypothetical protein